MPKHSPSFSDLILFQNEDYILINKPPFIATLEDRVEPVNILALAREVESDPQVCHRLDKDTSGVLAIARNPEAYRHLSMQFEHREVSKVYHAVVDGIQDFENVIVNKSILKQNDGTVKLSSQGKEAETSFSTLKTFYKHSLIECHPVTGRMHQIRIHLSSLKAPITGDEMYGGKPFLISEIKRNYRVKKDTEEVTLIKRMALHAFSLEFSDLKGNRILTEAPYPKDFTAMLKQLSANVR
ncbi:MAG: RluA family pseudouridine synthase [Cyclobacteriaceae bacterium]|nr:RluA family pseudouridine synthase [Cyclobacteriaceae bacterium]